MSTEKHRLLCRQRLFALNQKFCRSLKFRTGSKEEVAQLQARCDEVRHHPEPTQYARDEGDLSQQLEWMQMEED